RNGYSSGRGDGVLHNFELGTGIEKHVNDFRTMIAFGAKVNYLWGDLDFTYKPSKLEENYNVNVEIGDPAGESESYTRIISDERERTSKGSINGLVLTLPIGFETKLSDKLTLRLGARSVIPLKFNTEWETKTTDNPDLLLESTEDESTFTPPEPFPVSQFKKMNIDGKSLNLDSYHFGASYTINEYITIDLLHFAKVTELDTWWLSVVLRY
ncbi:hypothetical protein ACFL6L_04040, partial [candidate division KSB1 bacterium]